MGRLGSKFGARPNTRPLKYLEHEVFRVITVLSKYRGVLGLSKRIIGSVVVEGDGW